jgi:hypothetical protein
LFCMIHSHTATPFLMQILSISLYQISVRLSIRVQCRAWLFRDL